MATPTQLSAPEQDTLVKQIGLALLRAAPRDWKRISANYRTVGRYHELDGEITLADGTVSEWVATHDIATLFGRLRSGMYREERGTWFNAHYSLDAPASYNLEYDREEPKWDLLPPKQAYADELRMFPRTDENVPEWLMRRLAGLGPERPGPRLRIARVFDGTGEGGRPVINRAELPDEEQDRLLDYLAAAPVVLPGRGFDIDRLAATPEPAVPVGFHSDGTWIWPAAVHFYLQEYGVTPDQELVEHIRDNDYQVPDVSDEQKAAANEYLTRGPAAPEGPTALAAPPMPRTDPTRHMAVPEMPAMGSPVGSPSGPPSGAPEVDGIEATQAWQPPPGFADEDAPNDEQQYADDEDASDVDADATHHDDEQFADEGDNGRGPLAAAGSHAAGAGLAAAGLAGAGLAGAGLAGAAAAAHREPDHAPSHREPDHAEAAHHEPDDDAAHREEQAHVSTQYFSPVTDDEPDGADLAAAAGPPSQEPVPSGNHVASSQHAADDLGDEPALEQLQSKLGELGVPPTEYRIGGPTKLGWSLEEVPEGWRVGWYDDALADSSVFGDPDDAAAFMLGKVLLEPNGRSAPEQPSGGRSDEALAPLPPMPDTPGPGRHEPEPAEPPAPSAHGVTEPHHVPPPVPSPVPSPVPPAVVASAPPPKPVAARPPSSGAPSAPGNWPIQPMPGEPPLTLFRGKKLEDLPPGSELDRFGGPDGNLTYAAGTPYAERSLVPEWVNRPYHVYRVQQPLEVLSGVSIPWFNQPGGGSAFILPASVEQLLAEGVLIELDPGEPPID